MCAVAPLGWTQVDSRPGNLARLFVVLLALSVLMWPALVFGESCPDADSDGVADCTIPGCEQAGLVCGDCDDGDPARYPGASEICNQVDDNCDGTVDEGWTRLDVSQITAPSGVCREEFGRALVVMEDLDGDGVPELAVRDRRAVVILSGATRETICETDPELVEIYDGFAGSLALGIDRDGDGLRDLLVGVENMSLGDCKGLVRIISAADCRPLAEFGDVQPHCAKRFGATLDLIADIDGDGSDDVVVGAPGRESTEIGVVTIHSGADDSLLTRVTWPDGPRQAKFGHSLLAVDDWTGDGTADLVIGAGRQEVLWLASGATGELVRASVPGDPWPGPAVSLAPIEDLDGDGTHEILAGSPDMRVGAQIQGGVVIVAGGSLEEIRRLHFEELCRACGQGRSVAALPDRDGDGFEDVLAGAPDAPRDGEYDYGLVAVFSSVSGQLLESHLAPESPERPRRGQVVAYAGDLSGDGIGDLIATAPSWRDDPTFRCGALEVLVRESDCDGDGQTSTTGDCDDASPDRHRGLDESCDGVDNDCDGRVDQDADGDGFDVCADCHDENPRIHPGAVELCNDVDDDCDGSIDEGEDLDGDGYGPPCDCDESDPARSPDAEELCNHVDDDCDGAVDEGFPRAGISELHGDEPGADKGAYAETLVVLGDVTHDGRDDYAVGLPNRGFGVVHVISGADGQRVCSLQPHDFEPGYNHRFGWRLANLGDINGDGIAEFATSAPFASPIGGSSDGVVRVYSGRNCGMIRQFVHPAGASPAQFGYGLAAVPDVTGDGRAELAVGAPMVDGTAGQAGNVYLYDVAEGRLLWSADNAMFLVSANLGSSLAGTTDLTGDGIPDVIAGAPWERVIGQSVRGSVSIFSGADGSHHVKYVGTSGSSLLAHPDLDGDGFADFFVNARDARSGRSGELLYQLELPAVADGIGYHGSLALLPDFDGDGVEDLVLGNPGYYVDPYNVIGAVHLYSGSDGAMLETLFDGQWSHRAEIGRSMGVGDVNGDGVGEILAGAPGLERPDYPKGAVVLYSLRADCDGDGAADIHGDCDDSDADRSPLAAELCDGVDNDCDGSVDEDDDGDPDGVCDDCDSSRPDVYRGAPELCNGRDDDCDGAIDEGEDADEDGHAGPCDCDDSDPLRHPGADDVCNYVDDDCDGVVDALPLRHDLVEIRDEAIARPQRGQGERVAALGDIDGDGSPDYAVRVSDPLNTATSQVYVYSGATRERFCELQPPEGSSTRGFGVAMVGAGDLDGDDQVEILVGDPGAPDEGAVVVYDARTCRTEKILTNTDASARGFGTSVALYPDFDGDGLQDLLVGAPKSSGGAGQGESGAAFLISSASGAVLGEYRDPHRQARDQLGTSIAAIDDIDGDGTDDVASGALYDNEFGSVHFYSGGSGTLLGKVFDGGRPDLGFDHYAGFGWAMVRLNDIDGDGYDELAVSAPAVVEHGSEDRHGRGNVAIVSPKAGVILDRYSGDYSVSAGGGQVGRSLARMPDLDGDGLDEVVIGAPTNGIVYVYSPGADDKLLRIDSPRSVENSRFGFAVGVLGDLGGGALPEILIGDPFVGAWQGDAGPGSLFFASIDSDCDDDGFGLLGGDCDDADDRRAPDLDEVCDEIDNDCNDQVDDDERGVESDGDGLANACDNCPLEANEDQADFDEDGWGDVCEVGARLGDIDHSYRVDGFDLARLARAFGQALGDPGYDRHIDLNRDGLIDGEDLSLLASAYGENATEP